MQKHKYLSSSFRDASQVAGLLVVFSFVKDEVTETINTLVGQWQAAETSTHLQLLLPFNLHIITSHQCSLINILNLTLHLHRTSTAKRL